VHGPIRKPEQFYGDYLALLGSVRIAERRILEMGAEFGWDTLDRYTRQWFDYSEQMMDAAIRKMPAGRASAYTAHDPSRAPRTAFRSRRWSRSSPTRAGSRSTSPTIPTACRMG
jgi:N-methylhydantoinase B/oxoprolinase/acetone carboxylase alpha subunit